MDNNSKRIKLVGSIIILAIISILILAAIWMILKHNPEALSFYIKVSINEISANFNCDFASVAPGSN